MVVLVFICNICNILVLRTRASRIMETIYLSLNSEFSILSDKNAEQSRYKSPAQRDRSRYCPKMFKFRSSPIWTSIFITQKDLSIFALWNQTYLFVAKYIGAPMFYIRCQTAPSLWTLGSDQPVIPRVAFIR